MNYRGLLFMSFILQLAHFIVAILGTVNYFNVYNGCSVENRTYIRADTKQPTDFDMRSFDHLIISNLLQWVCLLL